MKVDDDYPGPGTSEHACSLTVYVEPVAEFRWFGSAQDPLSAQFIDQSTNMPTAWEWEFGDGTGSTERSPVHTYAAPGTYDVYLRVSNPDGPGFYPYNEKVTVPMSTDGSSSGQQAP